MSDDVDKGQSILVPYSFNNVEIVEIEYEGKPVFLAQQVGAALGYADPSKLSKNIAEKWSADFQEGRDFLKLTNGTLADFKAAVNQVPDRDLVENDWVPDQDPVVDPRTPNLILLTESGAQLAAILSRTSQGRAFRRWLVDTVLPAWRDRHAVAPAPDDDPPLAAPSAATPHPPEASNDIVLGAFTAMRDAGLLNQQMYDQIKVFLESGAPGRRRRARRAPPAPEPRRLTGPVADPIELAMRATDPQGQWANGILFDSVASCLQQQPHWRKQFQAGTLPMRDYTLLRFQGLRTYAEWRIKSGLDLMKAAALVADVEAAVTRWCGPVPGTAA